MIRSIVMVERDHIGRAFVIEECFVQLRHFRSVDDVNA